MLYTTFLRKSMGALQSTPAAPEPPVQPRWNEAARTKADRATDTFVTRCLQIPNDASLACTPSDSVQTSDMLDYLEVTCPKCIDRHRTPAIAVGDTQTMSALMLEVDTPRLKDIYARHFPGGEKDSLKSLATAVDGGGAYIVTTAHIISTVSKHAPSSKTVSTIRRKLWTSCISYLLRHSGTIVTLGAITSPGMRDYFLGYMLSPRTGQKARGKKKDWTKTPYWGELQALCTDTRIRDSARGILDMLRTTHEVNEGAVGVCREPKPADMNRYDRLEQWSRDTHSRQRGCAQDESTITVEFDPPEETEEA
jgi:hypothetical protein